MRKKVFALALAMAMVIAALTGCTNYDKTISENGWIGMGNSEEKVGCVEFFRWDGDESAMRLVVPEEVDGYRITKVGGTTLQTVAPFYVDCAKMERVNAETVAKENVTDLVFTLVIGKYIEDVEYEDAYQNEYLCKTEDKWKASADRTNYHVLVKVELDPENPYLYMKDGQLYKKENDKQVNSVFYVEPVEDTK